METSPEEALTALEMGLAVSLSDGKRFWKTPDGIYHCDDRSLFARLASPFLADVGGDLTSSDLFSLLVVLTFRGAMVLPIEAEETVLPVRTEQEVLALPFFQFVADLETRSDVEEE